MKNLRRDNDFRQSPNHILRRNIWRISTYGIISTCVIHGIRSFFVSI